MTEQTIYKHTVVDTFFYSKITVEIVKDGIYITIDMGKEVCWIKLCRGEAIKMAKAILKAFEEDENNPF